MPGILNRNQVIPVSYTHLDVYKRQCLPCIRPKWSGQKWAGKDRQLNLPSCIIDGTLSRNVRCTKERTDGMEWLEAMKEAVNYMEAHLMENITAEDIAAHINLSPFYFQKGFKMCIRDSSPQWFNPLSWQQLFTWHSPPQNGFSMVRQPVQ